MRLLRDAVTAQVQGAAQPRASVAVYTVDADLMLWLASAITAWDAGLCMNVLACAASAVR
jgi:hypothetical protein